MLKLAELVDQELAWSQPSALKMEFELSAGGKPVGALKFRNSFGSHATATLADGEWTFKRIGFWRNWACIREAGSSANLAMFQNNTWKSGGTLQFIGGRSFRASTHFWQKKFMFKDETKEKVVRFRYGGVFHRSAIVDVTKHGRDFPELPMLILFGWYLVIMLESDSIVAASAAAG